MMTRLYVEISKFFRDLTCNIYKQMTRAEKAYLRKPARNPLDQGRSDYAPLKTGVLDQPGNIEGALEIRVPQTDEAFGSRTISAKWDAEALKLFRKRMIEGFSPAGSETQPGSEGLLLVDNPFLLDDLADTSNAQSPIEGKQPYLGSNLNSVI